MTIKIEAGIAIPVKTERQAKYPFKDMKIGDSFLFPVKHPAHSSIKSAETKYNMKFKVAKTDAGYRCWRTA